MDLRWPSLASFLGFEDLLSLFLAADRASSTAGAENPVDRCDVPAAAARIELLAAEAPARPERGMGDETAETLRRRLVAPSADADELPYWTRLTPSSDALRPFAAPRADLEDETWPRLPDTDERRELLETEEADFRL